MIIATSILGFSIAGLAALVSVKMWEERSGRFLFRGARAYIGTHATHFLASLRGEVPHSLSRLYRSVRRAVRAYSSYAFAHTLLFFERTLERILYKVRTTPEAHARGEASHFLREVAAYKRMIGREGGRREEGAREEDHS